MICTYSGRTITTTEYEGHETKYAMGTSFGTVILPDVEAIGGHLANHSCDPNAIYVESTPEVELLRARKPIRGGEEITAYYGWISFADDNHCRCDARVCSGWMGLRLLAEDQNGTPFACGDLVTLVRTAARNRNDEVLPLLIRLFDVLPDTSPELSQYIEIAAQDLNEAEEQWLRATTKPLAATSARAIQHARSARTPMLQLCFNPFCVEPQGQRKPLEAVPVD